MPKATRSFTIDRTVFQSYLIYGPDPEQVRAKTIELAQKIGMNLASNSPDIFFISPITKSVTIDQIRDLKAHIHQKPLKSKNKLIVIVDAHLATVEAQNALLKTLEEPPSHAVIVLEAKNKETLLPTILSRVVKIPTKLEPPDKEPQILGKNLKTLLAEVVNVEEPVKFLDGQMLTLSALLMQKAKRGEVSSTKPIVEAIEACRQTRQMIEANVNPRFALANLVFSLNVTIVASK